MWLYYSTLHFKSQFTTVYKRMAFLLHYLQAQNYADRSGTTQKHTIMKKDSNKKPFDKAQGKNIQEANIFKVRHSLSHLLATAVLEQYPKTTLGIGPVIDNGFY